VALLVHALIERELRRAMADAGKGELRLYHEDQPWKAPTAARVLELLDSIAFNVVRQRGQVLTVIAPTLCTLGGQILDLLDVALSASITVR